MPICFNSKLVRLEVYIPNRNNLIISCFNSKLVRLEENSSKFDGPYKQRFNSKLVRLEVTPVACFYCP